MTKVERAEMSEYVLLLPKALFVEFKNTTIFLGTARHLVLVIAPALLTEMARKNLDNDVFTVVLDAGHGGKDSGNRETSIMKNILL